MVERFNSINEIQSIQSQWEAHLVPEEERTPKSRFERMGEEVEELKEAIEKLDGTPERQLEAGYELADVFIIGLGLADALGFDIERLIYEKMTTNLIKYNPIKNGELRANGLTHAEARQVQKSTWKKP